MGRLARDPSLRHVSGLQAGYLLAFTEREHGKLGRMEAMGEPSLPARSCASDLDACLLSLNLRKLPVRLCVDRRRKP